MTKERKKERMKSQRSNVNSVQQFCLSHGAIRKSYLKIGDKFN